MSATSPIIFWDVDTQTDFMMPDGNLYVPGADELLDNLDRLTRAAAEHDIPIVASADDHRSEDEEISNEPDFAVTFPPHCMHGTPGAERVDATRQDWTVDLGAEAEDETELRTKIDAARPVVLLRKNSLDVFSNPNTETVLYLLDPVRVVVYGVATDFCNRAAVEGLLERDFAVTLVTDAVQGIDPERSRDLLADWQSRGVDLRTTDELLAELDGGYES
ncbi:MAG: cysteine hydrolase [Acidobacteriota bacterium]|nr:cysteine hydrolase [Acidobacteriota bacterium]